MLHNILVLVLLSFNSESLVSNSLLPYRSEISSGRCVKMCGKLLPPIVGLSCELSFLLSFFRIYYNGRVSLKSFHSIEQCSMKSVLAHCSIPYVRAYENKNHPINTDTTQCFKSLQIAV